MLPGQNALHFLQPIRPGGAGCRRRSRGKMPTVLILFPPRPTAKPHHPSNVFKFTSSRAGCRYLSSSLSCQVARRRMRPRSRGAWRAGRWPFSPRDRKGAGNAGREPHPQPRVEMKEPHEHSHHRFSRNIPAFPAQWFYGFLRALPGDLALLPPSSARCKASSPT